MVRRSRGVALAVLLMSAGLLVACGGGDSGGGSDGSSVVVLDDDQVEKALLTLANMPDGWTKASDDDDDDDEAPGCLKELDELEEPESEADADVDYEVDDELGLPAVSNAVASFKSDREVTDVMDTFRDALDDCEHVEYTDPEDGTEYELDFESNDEKSSSKVDDQFNFTVTGTISNGLEFPFGMWLSVSRVDNHTTSVMVTDLSDDSASLLDSYTSMAVDRLVAVADGDEPVATQGPSAGSEADATGDESGDESFEQLPLDGGSYTWESSGVTVKLTVVRVEPWGTRDDFCGDGSCGVANPDDTRVVIRYDVTVPADASAPFDASGCPGQLYPTSGSEDDALHNAAGEYYKALDGKVFPGATKTGVDEYVIEKAYADQEFYIESSCGDTDFDGETAYFTGTFDRT